MPIYTAAKSLILHFGHGDIAVNHARNVEKPYEDEICFVRQTRHGIGERVIGLEGKQTDQIDCPVRFVFDSVESLDVVIDSLKALRDKLPRNPQRRVKIHWDGMPLWPIRLAWHWHARHHIGRQGWVLHLWALKVLFG